MSSNMDKILNELVETEKTYSEYLRWFANALNLCSQSFEPDEEMLRFMESYQQISDLHQELCASWGNKSLEQILMSFIEHKERMMSVYSKYLASYSDSAEVIGFKSIQKNQPLLKQSLLESGVKDNDSIELFVVYPRGRIPRYILLLKELQKTLGTSDALSGKVSLAIESLQAVGEASNDAVRSRTKLKEMFARFVDGKGPSLDLMDHKFLFESSLWKMCGDQEVQLHYWLLERLLVIGRQNDRGKFELLHQEPINSTWIAEEKSDGHASFVLSMGNRKDKLRAEDEEVANIWVSNLKQCSLKAGDVSDQKEKDVHVCNACEVCEKEFTWMKKKVECITCGRFVHKECSKVDSSNSSRSCKIH
jgi:hypothetical protein